MQEGGEPISARSNGIEDEAAAKIETLYYDLVEWHTGNDRMEEEETSARIRQAARWAMTMWRRPWLFLIGPTGTGKTTLAKAILGYLEQKRTDESGYRSGGRSLFAGAKDINRRFLGSEEQWTEARSKEILCVDDLGAEALEVVSFGNVETPVTDLIERRYDRHRYAPAEMNRITVFTSNLDMEGIYDRYGPRVADRIRGMATIIEMKGRSFRR